VRPRRQEGSIIKRGGMWVLRYYEYMRDGNGKEVRVRRSRNIAPVNRECPTETHARNRADDILRSAGVNTTVRMDAALTFENFVEKQFLPHCEQRLTMSGDFHLEPSTLEGYRDIWKMRIKDTDLTKIKMQDFTTAHVQTFFNRIDQKLAHTTHLRESNHSSRVSSRMPSKSASTTGSIQCRTPASAGIRINQTCMRTPGMRLL
jgi:hypothetical protein